MKKKKKTQLVFTSDGFHFREPAQTQYSGKETLPENQPLLPSFPAVSPVPGPDEGCDGAGCLSTKCNVCPFSTSIIT